MSGGDDDSAHGELDVLAWFRGNAEGTHSVKQKQPNAWGNVRHAGPCSLETGYSHTAQQDPQGPSKGAERVIRGGSWDLSARYCRAALRNAYDPSLRDGYLGFRFVRGQAAPGVGPEGP